MTSLPMSQGDLYLLPLTWQHYADHQKASGKYKQRYSATLGGEALVPAGEYTVGFSGAGYLRQEVAATVEAGVKKRVDGVLEKG